MKIANSLGGCFPLVLMCLIQLAAALEKDAKISTEIFKCQSKSVVVSDVLVVSEEMVRDENGSPTGYIKRGTITIYVVEERLEVAKDDLLEIVSTLEGKNDWKYTPEEDPNDGVVGVFNRPSEFVIREGASWWLLQISGDVARVLELDMVTERKGAEIATIRGGGKQIASSDPQVRAGFDGLIHGVNQPKREGIDHPNAEMEVDEEE